MCLGIPGRVITVDGLVAVVDFWGTRKPVSIETLAQPVVAGDYVINHAGFAVRRIPAEEVMDTLAMYEVVLAEGGEDPILCNAPAEPLDELVAMPARVTA